MLTKIVSGGQTGVDRAALDAAQRHGIARGGWCPKGRLAEDGCIPPEYPLTETESADYPQRTRMNVEDSDGTLILTVGVPDGGTLFTRVSAEDRAKPWLVVDLGNRWDPARVIAWIEQHHIRCLNVAGPRESKRPGIYQLAGEAMDRILEAAGR